MTRQMPLMFGILVVNMVALVFPYSDQVPVVVLWGVPSMFFLVFILCSHRQFHNYRQSVSDEKVLRDLNLTTGRSAVLGSIFIIWAFVLFSYDLPVMKIHIAFFLYISLICCAFFLMHVLQSVVVLTLIIILPIAIYAVVQGDLTFTALTIKSILVLGGIMFLLFSQYENFKNLVRQKVILTQRKNSLIEQAQKLEQMNARNEVLANVDMLTSLPNRRSFFAKLDGLIEQYENQKDKTLVVGLLDLDGFKRINDVFGHPTGDDLLIKTSERLKDVLGENIMLSRLGGDEFGLIITNEDDLKNIWDIGQRICDAMRVGFHLREGNVQVAATVGFVEYPKMASSARLLFERADYALCYSKQHSKGEPVIFSGEHETQIRDISNIEHHLAEADLTEELSVMFQPIVDIHSQKTVGLEALARWNNPALGNVRPDVFIRSAEQMGIIGKLTSILLNKALKDAVKWPTELYLSFNLSIFDLSSPETVLSMINIIEKSNFPSGRIVFEVTETAIMHDFKRANESLNLLKLMGCRIALDDFGTGYSSLSYVQRLPLDRLKIDRSFINEIATDMDARNIVKTIIDLCNNLNLYCIVEGVETKEQLDVIKELGCRYVQGYYFSPPLLADDAREFVKPDAKLRA
ncbi:MAG: EAL domain-containing protein [Rhizobiales bacterium]|nr:EAL domain-containing protein [Hyphomicrobiales bacterium]NRB12794.1 EAL domain-containing protein [Hyphomicrobiales bacterium]